MIYHKYTYVSLFVKVDIFFSQEDFHIFFFYFYLLPKRHHDWIVQSFFKHILELEIYMKTVRKNQPTIYLNASKKKNWSHDF